MVCGTYNYSIHGVYQPTNRYTSHKHPTPIHPDLSWPRDPLHVPTLVARPAHGVPPSAETTETEMVMLSWRK